MDLLAFSPKQRQNAACWLSIYVIRFAKSRHNDAFLEILIFASLSSIYLKLCSVAIPMLYWKYFSSYKARWQEKQNISFVRIPTALHVFNYTTITYRYSNIRSWNKDHSTQYKMAIPIIYRFLRKYKY